MFCQLCLKNNATIQIQEVIDGDQKARYYCGSCAKKKGFSLHSSVEGHGITKCTLSISPIIDPISDKSAKYPQTVCPECSMTSDELKKNGRMGCSNCYEIFAEFLDEILPEMHKGNAHRGKMPKFPKNNFVDYRSRNATLSDQCKTTPNLDQKLKKAVSIEDFELAAILRDQLKKSEL